MRFVEIDGVVHHVDHRPLVGAHQRAGEGPPTLVLIHSLGASLDIWDGVVECLRGRFPILRYDLPGHGCSEVVSGSATAEVAERWGIAELASSARELARAVGCGSVVPVGVSLGGLIAQRWAIDAPASVAALCLAATAARIGEPSLWADRSAQIRAAGLAAASGRIVKRWFGPDYRAANRVAMRGYRRMLERTPEAGYLAAAAAIAGEDLRSRVGSITCDALVLAGGEDAAIPLAATRALAGSLPCGELRVLAGVGHLPCVEAPERFAELLVELLERRAVRAARWGRRAG